MMTLVEQLNYYRDQFIEYLKVEQKKSMHTYVSYNLDLGKCIKTIESIKDKKSLTIAQILENYVKEICQSNLTKSSIARKISCFSTFVRFLNAKGIVVDITLYRPQFKEKAPLVFSMDKILKMLENTINHKNKARCYVRERAIWELLCATGMRCSEIIALKIDDICLQEYKVAVKDSKNVARMLFFDQRTATFLKNYLEKERPRYNPKETFLFLNSAGNRLTRRAIQRSLKLLAKLLNIEAEITPHTLRHSYATNLLKNGASLEQIKNNLGLRTCETVEKYVPYAK